MLKKFALLTILLPVFANASWLQERRCDQINETGFAIGVYTAQCGVSVDEIQQNLKKASAPNFCANYDAEINKLLRKHE